MTAKQLHKQLGKIIEKNGNIPVCVDWAKLRDNHSFWDEDASCVGVTKAEALYVYESDGDGGTKVNKDGTERGKVQIVLS